MRLHQDEVHSETDIGAENVRVGGGGESKAFGNRVSARAVDQFQIVLLFVGGAAD